MPLLQLIRKKSFHSVHNIENLILSTFFCFQYLDHQKNIDLTKDNFTFSCRVIIGDYLQPVPAEMVAEAGEYVHLSEDDVNRR